MSFLVAVTGKGGTGKSTTAAILVKLLMAKGIRPILAVDADPNSTLAPLLGVKIQSRMSDIREEIMEKKAEESGTPKERLLEHKLQECIAEAKGFDLLTMGRPEGPDCYCYVNNLVRRALESLKGNYRAIVIDNEAGMEHLSRMNTSEIDCLLLVSEPTQVSARSAARIIELADNLPVAVRRRVMAWNKVTDGGIPKAASDLIPAGRFDRIVSLPFSEQVGRLAAEEASALEIDTPAEFNGLMDACIMGLRTDSSK
jgi:CO dehydrogenase maturation factor